MVSLFFYLDTVSLYVSLCFVTVPSGSAVSETYFERKKMDTMFSVMDELQRQVSQGQTTMAQLEWFLHLTQDERHAFMTGEKFSLLIDLGTITVPDDYVHANQLAMFRERSPDLNLYNIQISDQNFSNPSRILKPGEKFRVRAFKHAAGLVSNEECLNFLVSRGAVHLGAQGASLVFDQKRPLLPKSDGGYTSLDVEDRLPFFPGMNCRGVPCIVARKDDVFDFLLCRHDHIGGSVYLLCFTEV